MSGTSKAYEDPGTPEEISRRSFMAGATVFLGSVVGVSIAIPVITTLVPTKEVVFGAPAPSQWPLDASEMAQLQASTDKPTKIYFTHHVVDGYLEGDPQEYVWGIKLNAAGIARIQQSRPEFPGLKVDVDGVTPYPVVNMGFVMFSPICPHLGCRFNWDDGQNKFLCPCHGSQYSLDGAHLAGPAPRGLDPLPFEEKSGSAEITWIRYKQGEPDRIVVSFS